jgi:hypothetical protein
MARLNNLQRARVLSHSLTSASWLFGVVLPRLEVVEMDCTGITDFSRMFGDLFAAPLSKIELTNTSSGTNFESMFNGCQSLQSVPLLDTSSGTNFRSMFNNCQSLQSVPLLDTSSGTNFQSMFDNCLSLQSVPLLDTSSGTNFGEMFNGCQSLQSVPLLDTSSGTNFRSMFSFCRSLNSVTALDVSSATELGVFIEVAAVSRIDITAWPTDANIGLNRAFLSAVSLNQIFTDLPSTTTGEIDVSGNYGTADEAFDPTIATAKGWEVYY